MLVLSKIIPSTPPSPCIAGVKYPYLTSLNLQRSTLVFAVYQRVLTDGCLIVYLSILFTNNTVTATPCIMFRYGFGLDRHVIHTLFHILFVTIYNCLIRIYRFGMRQYLHWK